jgi:PAS domain S-box-containing protein
MSRHIGGSACLLRANQRCAALDSLDAIKGLSWAGNRFTELFQDLPVICFSYDKDGVVYEWNQACKIELGFSSEQLLRRPVWDTLYQREDKCLLRKMASDVYAGKTYSNVEMMLVRADSTTFSVINNTFPIKNSDGSVAGIVSVNINIERHKQTEIALRQSEERLNMAMDLARLRSWEWDLASDIVHWSERDAARMDLPPDCLCMPSDQFMSRIHPEDRPYCYEAIRNSRLSRAPVEIEYRVNRPDGTMGWQVTRANHIFDANGKAVQLVGSALDISEIKNAEAELRQAHAVLEVQVQKRTEELALANKALQEEVAERQLYSDIVEHINTGIVAYHQDDEADDYSFRRILVNPAMKTQPRYMYSLELGLYIRQILPPGLVDVVAREFSEVVRHGMHHVKEAIDFDENGAVRHAVRICTFPLPNRCVGLHIEDITERRSAEQELEQAHAENAHILSSIASILISVDAKETVTSWNTMAKQAFGLARNAAIGIKFTDIKIPWDWKPVIATIRECQRTNEPVQLDDLHYTTPDGRDRFLAVTINPLRNENDQASGYLFLGTDITKRKVMESQLAQAQKLESIGSLAAGIAHEINTPIQYIGDNTRFLDDAFQDFNKLVVVCKDIANIEEAERHASSMASLRQVMEDADIDYLTQEIPNAIAQSLEGVERVAHIVRAMKEFSHPGQEEITAIDLNHAIDSTVTVARNEWKYVAEVVMDFADNMRPVPCYPGALNQVILNMIVNSAHAIGDVVAGTNSKGVITISTREETGFVEIRINDTGSGMPPEVIAHIYDPFFTTKPVGRGTGQGLAISHRVIVEKHRGTIDVSSEEGHGTTFTIRLPIDSRRY